MAELPIRRFYKIWMPYTNRVSNTVVPVAFWVQMPDPDSILVSHPIVIAYQGTNCWIPSTGGSTIEGRWNHNNAGSDYYTHPAIVIMPQLNDAELSEHGGSQYLEDFYRDIQARAYGENFRPLKQFIDSLITGDTIFYSNNSFTEQWSIGTDFARPTVNTNKIYYIGYSHGSILAVPAMIELRDYLAGVIMGGCSPHPVVAKDLYRPTSAYYEHHMADALKAKIKSCYHIPLLCHSGDFDWAAGFYLPDADSGFYGLCQCYADIASELSLPNPSRFILYEDAFHAPNVSPEAWLDGTEYIKYKTVTYGASQYAALSLHTATAATRPDLSEATWQVVSKFSWSGFTSDNLFFDPAETDVQYFSESRSSGFLTSLEWLWTKTKQSQVSTVDTSWTTTSERCYRSFGLDNRDYAKLRILPRILTEGCRLSVREYDRIEKVTTIQLGDGFYSLYFFPAADSINLWLGEELLFNQNQHLQIEVGSVANNVDGRFMLDSKSLYVRLANGVLSFLYPEKFIIGA